MPKTALIVVDMVQTYDFEDAEALKEHVEATLEPMAALIDRAKDEAELVIYVNDNFGEWHSERARLVEQALEGDNAHLVEAIKPNDDALFIVKARHSIFYGTPLDYILDSEGIDEIVLTGQVTEQCILYSALHSHVRGRSTTVARDAVAHTHECRAEAAVKRMGRSMDATICTAGGVRF